MLGRLRWYVSRAAPRAGDDREGGNPRAPSEMDHIVLLWTHGSARRLYVHFDVGSRTGFEGIEAYLAIVKKSAKRERCPTMP